MGLRAAFDLQPGDPAERILAFADPKDLILTTTHGFGGFTRWIFGSVAETLIHDASIPVLVFKTHTQTSPRGPDAGTRGSPQPSRARP